MSQENEFDRWAAELEDGLSVTAGSLNAEAFYRRVERQRASAQQEAPLAVVLGQFLNLSRRDRKLSPEQLAEQIDIDTLTLLQIEEGRVVPEPRIVSRLARTLNVPPGRLMQLAGHTELLDQSLSHAACSFAMSAKSKPLDKEEREALYAFVKALTSE